MEFKNNKNIQMRCVQEDGLLRTGEVYTMIDEEKFDTFTLVYLKEHPDFGFDKKRFEYLDGPVEIEVTIEETISQKFKVKVSSLENAYEDVRRMYKDGEIVVENPSLTEANAMIGDSGVWNDLHV